MPPSKINEYKLSSLPVNVRLSNAVSVSAVRSKSVSEPSNVIVSIATAGVIVPVTSPIAGTNLKPGGNEPPVI